MAVGKVEIIQKEGAEVPVQVLASSIVKIANAVDLIARAGMNKKCIVTLLSASSGVSKRDVTYVFDALLRLRSEYLMPGAKP